MQYKTAIVSLLKVNPTNVVYRYIFAQLTAKQAGVATFLFFVLFFFLQLFVAFKTGITVLKSLAVVQLLLVLSLRDAGFLSGFKRFPGLSLSIQLVISWAAFLYSIYLLLGLFPGSSNTTGIDLFMGNIVFIVCLNVNFLFLESMAFKQLISLSTKKSGLIRKIVHVISFFCLANMLLGAVYNSFTLDLWINIFINTVVVLLTVFIAIDAYWRIMDCGNS